MTLNDVEQSASCAVDPVLPGAAAIDPALVGGKAAGLARLGQIAVVPEHVVVPTSWLPAAAGSQLAVLERCGLDERSDPERYALTAQRELADLELTVHQRAALQTAIERSLPGGGLLAVRSSASTEDGLAGSEAGVFASVLHVDSGEVEQALLQVWRSWWSASAVALRVRRGQRSVPPRMGVVIQRMVDPDRAGVVVTSGDRAEVESVAGPAHGLVSGEVAPDREVVTLPVPRPRTPAEHAAEVADRVRAALGAEADVEWAWSAGQLFGVQARPVVRAEGAPAAVNRAPLLRSTPLYGLVAPGDVVPLDEVGGLVAHARGKRLRLYALAQQHGCRVPSGVVLRYNRRGLLRREWTQLREELAGAGGQVVVDLDEQQRQHIVSVGEVTELLRTAAGEDPHLLRTVVVRQFRTGAAVVSATTDDDRVRLDYAPTGLFGLNRGWDSAVALELHDDGVLAAGELPAGCSPAALRRIAAVTQAFTHTHGPAALEWVLDQSEPVPLDYSPLGSSPSTAVHGRTLSPGACSGPALVVPSSAEQGLAQASAGTEVSVSAVPAPTEDTVAALAHAAQQYSDPPVLVTARPYAILATLIGYVSGVVVGHGAPRLSHLAILLREHGVPAAELPEDIDAGAITDGDHVAITDGQITTNRIESHDHDV